MKQMILPLLRDWNKQFWARCFKSLLFTYRFLPKMLKKWAAAGGWLSRPRGHAAFVSGFALTSWGEESQGFVLGPNTEGMCFFSGEASSCPWKGQYLLPPLQGGSMLRGVPPGTSGQWPRNKVEHPSSRRRICYSDSGLEASSGCLSQWFWSISETTTTIKYELGIFVPTDVA